MFHKVRNQPKYTKYKMMLKTGLPDGAVRQKMSISGMSADDIAAFFGESSSSGGSDGSGGGGGSSGSGKEKPGNIAAKKSLEVCFFLGVCGVCHACCMVSLGYPEQA